MKWSNFNVLFYSEKLGYALFNSRMMSLSVIDKETYEVFQKIKAGTASAKDYLDKGDLEKLIQGKILVSDNEDNEYISLLRFKRQRQSFTTKTLGMVICPTLACNFACPYCYEHNLPVSFMQTEVQNQLVDFINKNSERLEGFTINWHGGEPLMGFDIIKSLYSRFDDDVKLPITHSAMVTNGYLLNEEICKYLHNRHLNYIQITIDGNRETHNKKRKLKNGQSSFEQIIENVDMASEMMPNCLIGVRTNIGRDNREEYPALYEELSSRWKGRNVTIYHSFVLDNSLNTCHSKRCTVELNTREKNEFDIMLAENGIKSKKSLYPHLDVSFYTCMDNNAYVVDPNGLLYKCWGDVGIVDRSIGTLKDGIKNYRIVSQFMIDSDKFADSKCIECSFLPVCDGGCNLYRIGKIEKGIPYNVCNLDETGLARFVELYYEANR